MARDDTGSSLPPRILLAAGLLTVGFGIWGFARYDGEPALTHVYRSFQLFVVETGDVQGALPWQLEVARFSAVALTATSIGYAILAVSRGPRDRWRAHRARQHVVVCGLGTTGTSAAIGLHRAGIDVVAVEIDQTAAGIERCHDEGIPVIIGDARDPKTLDRAGLERSDHLVVLTETLESRGQIALVAAEAATSTHAQVAIHLELGDPALTALFQAAHLSSAAASTWQLEELDLTAAGARVMLDEQPAWGDETHDAHVLVVGASTLGIAVIRELRRRWRSRDDHGVLTVSVVADDPDGLPTSTDDVEIVASSLADLDHGLAAAFVCVEHEGAALAAGLAVVGRHRGVPTVVRIEHAAAFAALVHRGEPDLRPLAIDERVLTPATLLASQQEQIARSLHDFYRRTMARADDPSAAPWEQLEESLRDSNRSHAADIATKLAHAGFVVIPDDGAPPDPFTDAEVERLGELEHQRWVDTRLAAGWTPGPRDPVARTSPYLVPWTDLDEDVRDVDRQFVAALPDLLADAGLHLRRVRHR